MNDQIFEVNCGFFDSINKDRLYSADEMNRPYKRIITNGVFATQQGTPSTDLQVVSSADGMNIVVKKGEGMFGDKWFESPADIAITVPNNTSTVPRRDSVIAQVDKRTNGRKGRIVYRTGTANSNPMPPDLSTDNNVVEYRIANIYVAASAVYIGQDAITDLRGSSECPWITSLLKQVDTSALFAQYQAAYETYYNQSTANFEEYETLRQAEFDQFLKNLTSELSVATNIIMFNSNYVSQTDVTNIPIGIPSYDPTTDILQVYVNGIRVTEGLNYTLNSNNTSIDLTVGIKAGQAVNFLVLKSVIAADIQSTVTLIQALDTKVDAFMVDSGWINFTLENDTQAYSDGLTPGYRKYNNQVFLRGCIKNVTANGTVVATLPSGYRPAMTRYYTIATGSITATIEIGTNGQVKVANVIGTLAASSLIPIDTNFILN